jgi:hypothetical protein
LGERQACADCGALLWSSEQTQTNSICCGKKRANLDRWTRDNDNLANADSANQLYDMWESDTLDGKLLKKYSRQLNNALAISSHHCKEIRQTAGGNYNPTVTVQGRITSLIGGLENTNVNEPVYAQVYVHDALDADTDNAADNTATRRIDIMNLPASTSATDRRRLHELLKILHEIIGNVNEYVRDFISIAQSDLLTDNTTNNIRVVIDPNRRPTGEHARRYNAPEGLQEVCVLMADEVTSRAVKLSRGSGERLEKIDDTHRAFDTLHFVLFFPHAQDGWSTDMYVTNDIDSSRSKVSTKDFYCFHLHQRDGERPTIFYGKRLFHEYLCMAFVKIETLRLRYLKNNQTQLRAASYHTLQQATNHENANIGRQIILPSTFTGGPRYMQKHYHNAMSLVQKFGRPDLFLTMTCNPKWSEIIETLLPHQVPEDRPDLLARVFRGKFKQLMNELLQNDCLGRVVGYTYTIEFQKRGLPHAHLLIFLQTADKPQSIEDIDKFVRAEIPEFNPADGADNTLHEIVKQNMIHNPCGNSGPRASTACMSQGVCTRHFPKQFHPCTHIDSANGNYPLYQRRSPSQGGASAIKNGQTIDNSWVVPYNPYLLLRFNCHINLEVCKSAKATKYLFKYIHKGHDRVVVSWQEDSDQPRNEIHEYQDMRSIGACEAAWRIFGFDLCEQKPAVIPLPIHDEDQQQVYFEAGDEDRARENSGDTMLMAWMNYNAQNEDYRDKYCDVNQKLTWATIPHPTMPNATMKIWKPRIQNRRFVTLSRVYQLSPAHQDLFYLRILLHHDHCRGAKNWADLKTVDEVLYPTYKAVCKKLGLLEDDSEAEQCLAAAAIEHMPAQMRILYISLLEYCEPADPENLLTMFAPQMAEDYAYRYPELQQQLNNNDAVNEEDNLLYAMLRRDLWNMLPESFKQGNLYDFLVISADLQCQISNMIAGQHAILMGDAHAQQISFNSSEYINDAEQRYYMSN